MKLDALIEARVRMGEEVSCPYGCGFILRVWSAFKGDRVREVDIVNCGAINCYKNKSAQARRPRAKDGQR